MQLSQQNWNTLRTRGYITLQVFSNEERAKLKNELQVDSRDYWKTTHKALSGISEKLVKLAGKVGNLK